MQKYLIPSTILFCLFSINFFPSSAFAAEPDYAKQLMLIEQSIAKKRVIKEEYQRQVDICTIEIANLQKAKEAIERAANNEKAKTSEKEKKGE